jgi:hypothetical protein
MWLKTAAGSHRYGGDTGIGTMPANGLDYRFVAAKKSWRVSAPLRAANMISSVTSVSSVAKVQRKQKRSGQVDPSSCPDLYPEAKRRALRFALPYLSYRLRPRVRYSRIVSVVRCW